MDSSSEGSFAWTDDSRDSTDNETMTKTDSSINQSGEESESGKTYKKKLQQQLFSGTGEEQPTLGPPRDHRLRKRKLSRHQSDGDNRTEKKRVKTEPESDIDVPKKKKKQSSDTTGDLYDESFLNSKVKNEQCFAVPSPVKRKKNKKQSESGANDTSMNNGVVDAQSLSDSKEASNGRITFEDSSTPHSNHAEEEDINKYTGLKEKKNKKKNNKKCDRSVGDYVQNGVEEDNLHEQVTTVTDGHISMSADEPTDEPVAAHDHVEHEIGTSKKYKKKQDTTTVTDDAQNNTSLRINSESLLAKRKSRMSERIQFEEEDDSDVQVKSNNTETSIKSTDNKKLINFLESSVSLRPFRAKLPRALVLTEDDDVWLIRCPKHVPVEAFQDKKWSLDSRCKIKLDGQTYEGDIGDTNGNITISSSEKDRAVIENVTIKGCIRLRKKLPKAHVQEDIITVNKQTDFIPLPDTKCRHPLFGSNYKKAVKLPSGAAERLRAAERQLAAERLREAERPRTAPPAGRRRKRGREKAGEEPLDSRAAFKMEHNPGGEDKLTRGTIITKKKKKRKYSDAAQEELAPRPTPTPKRPKRDLDAAEAWEELAPRPTPAPKRPKRPKRDLDSAEAWDSEKAIEENLFNF